MFARIREAFPTPAVGVDAEQPDIDIVVSIPERLGFAFPVERNIQGGELHLSTGAFWLEWFSGPWMEVGPCEKRADYAT